LENEKGVITNSCGSRVLNFHHEGHGSGVETEYRADNQQKKTHFIHQKPLWIFNFHYKTQGKIFNTIVYNILQSLASFLLKLLSGR